MSTAPTRKKSPPPKGAIKKSSPAGAGKDADERRDIIPWAEDVNLVYEAVVLSEPSSKANSRRLIYVGRRPRLILSESAQQYCEEWKENSRALKVPASPVTFDVAVVMKIYYATRRKDLDESLVLDMLQGVAYVNDRQVKKKDITWGLDKEMPRCEIKIYSW